MLCLVNAMNSNSPEPRQADGMTLCQNHQSAKNGCRNFGWFLNARLFVVERALLFVLHCESAFLFERTFMFVDV